MLVDSSIGEKRNTINLIAIVILSFAGITTLFIAATASYKSSYIRNHGIRAEGIVKECSQEVTARSNYSRSIITSSVRRICLKYEVEFSTKDDQKIDFNADNVNGALKPEQTVSIVYMPADPKKTAVVEQDAPITFWLIGITFLICAGLVSWAPKNKPPTPKIPAQLP